jgi:glycogen(starch) synthase
MRILHVTQGYWPAIGGTELLMQRVSEQLVGRWRDDVTVFTTDCYNGDAFYTPGLPSMPVGWSELSDVRIRRFPVRRRISHALRGPQAWAYRLRLPFNERIRAWSAGPIVPGLREAIRSCPSDLVAAASFPLLHMFDSLAAARDTRRPCVLIGCLHPQDDWGFQRPMIYEAIRKADAYIALTDYEARYVVSRGARPERVHTAGAGVDVAPYRGIDAAEAKWRLGFDRRPVVGFIGQLAKHKGLDTLLRAMPRVWRFEPDVNLLIAGGRTLYAEEVERIISEWPEAFRRRCRLNLGFRDDQKPWLFGAVDMLACPSGYESFGITCIEAWAAGKPVIGARSGAVESVISEGTDGLLIDYQNEQELTSALLELLRHPARAVAMGAAGRAKVEERYTWERIGEVFRRVYESVAQQ